VCSDATDQPLTDSLHSSGNGTKWEHVQQVFIKPVSFILFIKYYWGAQMENEWTTTLGTKVILVPAEKGLNDLILQ